MASLCVYFITAVESVLKIDDVCVNTFAFNDYTCQRVKRHGHVHSSQGVEQWRAGIYRVTWGKTPPLREMSW